ncbi:DUF2191 domain-containing protein [Nocardia mangyaensis]|uniref:DUF2191 domain-containing protein n=1 Tax=Nocardia mangyaensis TaxID=2213200 RepID=UPI002676E40E|nr:DUF2191 domain-containing protein [Nocardia mangyaensis]MDO3648913.1 DUF2191 domain-containing protein [Nocardia mangyaensis]
MTKRLIEIDDELLESAQEALGTSGVSDTVRAALRSAAVAAARARHVEWLVSGGMAEMADKDRRDDVWR